MLGDGGVDELENNVLIPARELAKSFVEADVVEIEKLVLFRLADE